MKQQLEGVVETLLKDVRLSITEEITKTASANIVKHIVEDELSDLLEKLIEKKLKEFIEFGSFPKQTISHEAINFETFKLSGDKVNGGTIKNFNSTGIQDLSNTVQLTLLDSAAAFENSVYMPSAAIKGDLSVEGTVSLQGNLVLSEDINNKLVALTSTAVMENINEELFDGFTKSINKKFLSEGLDLDHIKQNGKDVIKANRLGFHIIDSNLQKLGIVKDLQTQGEALLSQTLYVTNRRVGINTTDPSSAFVVWDEEVEMVLAKRRKDEGVVGTLRNQKFIVGANRNDNLVCEVDGSVSIEKLNIGKIKISSSDTVPNYASGIGHIVFNQNPSLGGPMGWVCLGGPRWANFGIID